MWNSRQDEAQGEIKIAGRNINNLTKAGGLVKAMVFPVVIYGCESWTIKKAEL